MAVDWNSAEIRQRLGQAAYRGVLRGAQAIEARAAESILSGEKSGRLYVRRGVTHQASAPGEAPASDTGRLVNSSRIIERPEEFAASVNWSTDYALALELGTERMGARPFARPAVAESVEDCEKAVQAEIDAEFR